jgi:transcriptional regulator with XRE-family HTH domain
MELAGRHIPNRLTKHRMIHGVQQKDVARWLGHKSTAQLSQWENGLVMPGAINLLKLCIIYSTSPTELYYDVFKQQQEFVALRKQAFA